MWEVWSSLKAVQLENRWKKKKYIGVEQGIFSGFLSLTQSARTLITTHNTFTEIYADKEGLSLSAIMASGLQGNVRIKCNMRTENETG